MFKLEMTIHCLLSTFIQFESNDKNNNEVRGKSRSIDVIYSLKTKVHRRVKVHFLKTRGKKYYFNAITFPKYH